MPNDNTQVGGPGGDGNAAPVAPAAATPAPAAPQNTKVVIAGVEYEVPTELAASIRRDRDRLAGEYGSREQQYRTRLAELESTQAAADEPPSNEPEPPDHALIDINSDKYNPEKYHRENLAYQEYLVDSRVQNVEQRRLQESQAVAAEGARNAEWNRQVQKFYGEHPDLKGDEDIVDTVWRKEFNRLKSMPVAEGFAELARLSKERLVRTAEKGKALRSTPVLETSAASRRAAPKKEVDETPDAPGGLGRAIREKQRRFRTPDFKAAAAR